MTSEVKNGKSEKANLSIIKNFFTLIFEYVYRQHKIRCLVILYLFYL